jgi:hypothetical protein
MWMRRTVDVQMVGNTPDVLNDMITVSNIFNGKCMLYHVYLRRPIGVGSIVVLTSRTPPSPFRSFPSPVVVVCAGEWRGEWRASSRQSSDPATANEKRVSAFASRVK